MKISLLIFLLMLSGCAGRAEYYQAVQAQNIAISKASAERDAELARIAQAAGATNNTAAAMAVGYMIGSGNKSAVQKIEPPESGVAYLREILRLATYGVTAFAIDRSSGVVMKAIDGAGGNQTYGGDYVGGDNNQSPVPDNELEIEAEDIK